MPTRPLAARSIPSLITSPSQSAAPKAGVHIFQGLTKVPPLSSLSHRVLLRVPVGHTETAPDAVVLDAVGDEFAGRLLQGRVGGVELI